LDIAPYNCRATRRLARVQKSVYLGDRGGCLSVWGRVEAPVLDRFANGENRPTLPVYGGVRWANVYCPRIEMHPIEEGSSGLL